MYFSKNWKHCSSTSLYRTIIQKGICIFSKDWKHCSSTEQLFKKEFVFSSKNWKHCSSTEQLFKKESVFSSKNWKHCSSTEQLFKKEFVFFEELETLLVNRTIIQKGICIFFEELDTLLVNLPIQNNYSKRNMYFFKYVQFSIFSICIFSKNWKHFWSISATRVANFGVSTTQKGTFDAPLRWPREMRQPSGHWDLYICSKVI